MDISGNNATTSLLVDNDAASWLEIVSSLPSRQGNPASASKGSGDFLSDFQSQLRGEALLPISDRSFLDFDTNVKKSELSEQEGSILLEPGHEGKGATLKEQLLLTRGSKMRLLFRAGSYLMRTRLQPYQARVAWGVSEGHLKRVLINHKTGSGKTLTMLAILDESARKSALNLKLKGNEKAKHQKRFAIFYKNAHAKNFLQQILQEVTSLRKRLLQTQKDTDFF
eukprot:g8605.t1